MTASPRASGRPRLVGDDRPYPPEIGDVALGAGERLPAGVGRVGGQQARASSDAELAAPSDDDDASPLSAVGLGRAECGAHAFRQSDAAARILTLSRRDTLMCVQAATSCDLHVRTNIGPEPQRVVNRLDRGSRYRSCLIAGLAVAVPAAMAS